MASSPGPAATGAAKPNPRMVAAKIALNALDMTVAYSVISVVALAAQRRGSVAQRLHRGPLDRGRARARDLIVRGSTPEGLPGAATVAYLCPHHACPSTYSSDRLHCAVPSYQSPHASVRRPVAA